MFLKRKKRECNNVPTSNHAGKPVSVYDSAYIRCILAAERYCQNKEKALFEIKRILAEYYSLIKAEKVNIYEKTTRYLEKEHEYYMFYGRFESEPESLHFKEEYEDFDMETAHRESRRKTME